MPLITSDRVRGVVTSAPGTGNVTVSVTAVAGFDTLQTVLSVGDTFYYTIQTQTAGSWEVGLGTYSSANTVTRTTVFDSSNANALVNFTTTPLDIFITYPAGRAVHQARSMVYQMIFNL
jgi:hypothetical protein